METYDEHQIKVKTKQEALSRDDIVQQMEAKAEFILDLDNLPRVKHNLIRRGVVISCEHAGHPSHRHFLKKR